MNNCEVCGNVEGTAECNSSHRAVASWQGAEFLADPCVVLGCEYHYGHEGPHCPQPPAAEDKAGG